MEFEYRCFIGVIERYITFEEKGGRGISQKAALVEVGHHVNDVEGGGLYGKYRIVSKGGW